MTLCVAIGTTLYVSEIHVSNIFSEKHVAGILVCNKLVYAKDTFGKCQTEFF